MYFDAIHIDPWKKYPDFDEGLKWTVDLLRFCYSQNQNLYFEIGTEEAIRAQGDRGPVDRNAIDRVRFTGGQPHVQKWSTSIKIAKN